MRFMKYAGVGLALLAELFTAGCQTTVSRKQQPGPYPIVLESVVISSDILISGGQLNQKSSVEDILGVADNHIEYLKFRQKYMNYGERIVDSLKGNRFDEADNLVRELAKRLEADNGQYAKAYLEKVKDFNYIVYVINDAEKTVNAPRVDRRGLLTDAFVGWYMVPIGFLFDLIFLPCSKWKFFAGNHPREPFMATKEMIGATHPYEENTYPLGLVATKIRVNPYQGKRDVLEEDTPLERIKTELGSGYKVEANGKK